MILTPEAIEAMNRAATGRPETELVDVFAIPDPMEGALVRKAIAEVLSESRQTKGYDHTNRLITAAFYDRIEVIRRGHAARHPPCVGCHHGAGEPAAAPHQ